MNDDYLDDYDPEIHYSYDFENSIHSNYYSVDQYQSCSEKNSNMFAILNYNIRSFHKNINAFIPVFHENLPAALVLTETWFNINNEADINNYQSFHTIRSVRASGGVSIFIHESLKAFKIDSCCYVSNEIEVCSVEIRVNSEKIYLIGIYRPHSGTINGFLLELEAIFNLPALRNKRCFLAGDFNIRLNNESSENQQFIEAMRSYHFYPVITKPTRFPSDDRSQPSLLDLIFTNTLTIYNSGIIKYDITDHCPTFIHVPIENYSGSSGVEKVEISFRLNNISCKENFSRSLGEFDWSLIQSDDLDQYALNLTSSLDDLYCKSFPLKTKRISKQKCLNPWFSPEIRNLVNMKSTYFNLLRINAITKEENNRFKNKVKSAINKAKNAYYQNLFNRNMNNMRATWKTLNNLMGKTARSGSPGLLRYNGVEYGDDSDICEILSDYFYKVPLELDSEVPQSDLDPTVNVNNYVHAPLVFSPCTPDEVSEIIAKLKPTKQGKNNIPINLLVSNRDILAPIFCTFLNSCIEKQVFPNPLKIAKIIPIFKKGDPCEPSNYRPISILPYVSKIYEKNLYLRLANYFSENLLFCPQQFGFRSNMSTLDAIIHFTEILFDALNNFETVLNIFIDFSKAFDTVNHCILLRKLEKYGILGLANKLIENFLKNRIQIVHHNNSSSLPKISNIGVPQGSVLGPLLFLIFVNDLPQLSRNFLTTMFADDCSLQFVDRDLENLLETCNTELRIFERWSNYNRLTINIGKTYALLVSNIYDSIPEQSISFHDQPINFIRETKFLGVFLDNKLKFDKHIQSICSKVSKSVGILYRLKIQKIPDSCLRMTYFSLIHPYLIYCLPVFGSTYDCHLNPLIVLQKRAIRILNNADYTDHTNPLFFASKILKFKDQYKHSLGTYIYRNTEILDNFTRNHNYSTRQRNEYLAPFARLRSTQQSVLFNAINNWNSIPDNIKNSISLPSFKYKYKQHLLESYEHS